MFQFQSTFQPAQVSVLLSTPPPVMPPVMLPSDLFRFVKSELITPVHEFYFHGHATSTNSPT